MKKIIFALFLLLQNLILFSQEEKVVFSNDLKTSSYSIKESYTIFDDADNTLAVFLQDPQNVYGYLYDQEFNQLGKVQLPNLARKYKVFLGSSSKGKSKNIYLSNERKTKFSVIGFSFDGGNIVNEEIELKLKNEKFVQSVSLNNKFYILSTTKGQSLLNVYEFGENASYKKHTLDFSMQRMLDKDNKRVTLYSAMAQKKGGATSYTLEKVQYENPNSIETTSSKSKLYIIDNQIIITLDGSKEFTQIIKLDINNYTYELRTLEMPFISYSGEFKKSNSFIHDKFIYSIVSCSDEMTFRIQHLEDESIKKEYSIKKDEAIIFKNSPIIQEGGVYAKYRELEKTKRFLRKITSSDVGISVYKINNSFQITLGGVKTLSRGGAPMTPGFGGIPMGAIGPLQMSFNPTMAAFGSYTSTKSTYINCLFDEGFEHIEGDIQDNVFDKIDLYLDDNDLYVSAETVFGAHGSTYLGYFIKSKRQYKILKFED